MPEMHKWKNIHFFKTCTIKDYFKFYDVGYISKFIIHMFYAFYSTEVYKTAWE